jgi:hypothetical protein
VNAFLLKKYFQKRFRAKQNKSKSSNLLSSSSLAFFCNPSLTRKFVLEMRKKGQRSKGEIDLTHSPL